MNEQNNLEQNNLNQVSNVQSVINVTPTVEPTASVQEPINQMPVEGNDKPTGKSKWFGVKFLLMLGVIEYGLSLILSVIYKGLDLFDNTLLVNIAYCIIFVGTVFVTYFIFEKINTISKLKNEFTVTNKIKSVKTVKRDLIIVCIIGILSELSASPIAAILSIIVWIYIINKITKEIEN